MAELLITGSKGLLGTELKKHLRGIFIDAKEMDITNKESIRTAFREYDPEVVLHLAAFTDVAGAEYKKKECYRMNVWATEQLAIRSPVFIYVSTEHVFDGEKGDYHEGHIPNPVNFYSLTKLMGEIKTEKARKHVVIRTLFKPDPYPDAIVPTDMWTSGDYVSVIAPMIAKAVNGWQKLPRVIHIGGQRKNLFQLAQQTREVTPTKRINMPIKLPRDTSLNTDLWRMLYEK